jgi:murein DD-endopeptidase MepM/ murein hydrolase activator NlpD
MNATRRSASWPRLVAISLMAICVGMGLASCSSDSGRFSDFFGSNSTPRGETTGSIPHNTATSRVESQPLPHLASADPGGSSGGGRGMGSYQPANGEVTGSLPVTPPPTWTWEGGTPVVVGPGETLETISRQHGVPVAALMQANNITNPATVHPGQHLVIPRYRSAAGQTYVPPATRIASTTATLPPAGPVGAPRTALAPTNGMHVVAPGETLHSIARLYGKPVMVLAKANNIPPDTMVRVGERIVIPDVRPGQGPAVAPRAQAQVPATAAGPELATAESPHSARVATTEAPAIENPIKTAEPAGALTTFRWPVRGRVIAGFGPKPNGLQNDGINLAVPEGTPIKAAEDGVVAYAGNELKGYGNLVLVRHANGFVTAYAHASEILVKRGETVKRGQVIANSGQTGNVTSPQLHFEIRKGATPVDPAQYLNGA